MAKKAAKNKLMDSPLLKRHQICDNSDLPARAIKLQKRLTAIVKADAEKAKVDREVIHRITCPNDPILP
jgi:hypothetical protein